MLLAMPNRNEVLRRSLFASSSQLRASVAPHRPGQAQSADLVRSPVDPGSRVLLKGHHPPWATQNDAGAVPADLPIERVTIVLARRRSCSKPTSNSCATSRILHR